MENDDDREDEEADYTKQQVPRSRMWVSVTVTVVVVWLAVRLPDLDDAPLLMMREVSVGRARCSQARNSNCYNKYSQLHTKLSYGSLLFCGLQQIVLRSVDSAERVSSSHYTTVLIEDVWPRNDVSYTVDYDFRIG